MRIAQWLGCALALTAAVCAGQTSSSRSPVDGQQGSTGQQADTDWLTHLQPMYTSTKRDGLKGFDCQIYPDWRALVASANNGTVDADGEHRIAAMSSVRITMHARMDGTAIIDWTADDPPADLADMLNTLRDGTKQTLAGFVQFWAPFADASVIPSPADDLHMTRTSDGGRVIHVSDKDTTVTETFNAEGILSEYDVKMNGSTVLFTPAFTATPKGLRVTYFLAHIRPDNGGDQEMHVGVTYSEVDGFTIPSRLDMTVVGTGTFNFTMAGCRVNP